MNEDIRFKVVKVPYTLRDRVWWWWTGLKQAISERPPRTWSNYVRVYPGDPEYDTAPFIHTYDEHPKRFDFPVI